MKAKVNELLSKTEDIIKSSQKTLQINGEDYKLSEWITIKEYTKRYGLSNTNVVSNWIERGIIPKDDVIELPELNSIRLVKDKSYR